MNIFPINKDVKICAIESCDQHIVKIPSEAVLIYSSALHNINKELWNKIPEQFQWGPINIPLVKWAENYDNRMWLAFYIYELHKEYQYRFGPKEHKAYSAFCYLARLFKEMPYVDIFDYKKDLDFVTCMPDMFKVDDSIESYLNYYTFKYFEGFKRPMRWTKRKKPEFLLDK